MLILNILNFLKVTTILFFINILNIVLNPKNLPITLTLLELILLTVNINFTLFSIYFNDVLFLFASILNNPKPISKEILNITIERYTNYIEIQFCITTIIKKEKARSSPGNTLGEKHTFITE